MSSQSGAFVRVYREDDEENLYDTGETLDLADFCGTVPRAGDLIVSGEVRWATGADDARQKARLWGHRTVWVVKSVYLRPDKRGSDQDDSWAVIVVKDRPMTEAEQELL